MKALLNSLRRFSLTGLMVLAALWAGYRLWDYYMDAPWTRDGHVRADVVPVAPDVSGFVSEVLVRDNELVRRGDVLFRIDRARYAIALEQAYAVVAARRATLDNAESDLKRYSALTPGEAVSRQRLDQVVATQATAKANYDQAVADRALAQFNIERSEVRASVNGVVTNMELRPGTYTLARDVLLNEFPLTRRAEREDFLQFVFDGLIGEVTIYKPGAAHRFEFRFGGEDWDMIRSTSGRLETLIATVIEPYRAKGHAAKTRGIDIFDL
jgi:multidrug efflux pump subunit AcrA (membrane-fusion protein)